MSRKGDEHAGNSLAAQAAFERELYRMAQTWLRLEGILDRLYEFDVTVKRISIVLPTQDKPDYSAVITAWVGGEPCVGFHGGTTFVEAVTGLINRLENRSLKWRPDNYAK